MRSNYYISSFFWSTLAKILNAVLGFISIPLLLGLYGKAEYGILSIATACNAYMNILDLGMNTGAVRYFSQWRVEKKNDLIDRVARTNITFYLIIAVVNSIILTILAIYGENLFSVTHEQFLQLRICLLVIAFFSIFSWSTTAFNQLLIANKQIAFTMQMQCFQVLLKMTLVGIVLCFKLTLSVYFFWLTLISAFLFLPYIYKCKKSFFISCIRPATYWSDFRTILVFSLSIFVLSLFQMTSTQSRPILLSIFSENGASVVAEFRILEVIPMFVIMIGLTFSNIFLPTSSELLVRKQQSEIESFAYKWTRLTSILANILCIPFIFSSEEFLTAYVGKEYSHLSLWLIIWCITAIIQIHTTPGNSLILACGKTKLLVITSAVACIISMIMNIVFCKILGVGSAIVGYFIYVILVIGMNYIFYYKKILLLNKIKMFMSFMFPTIVGFVTLYLVNFLPFNTLKYIFFDNRFSILLFCGIKTIAWLIPYILLLFVFRIVKKSDLIK